MYDVPADTQQAGDDFVVWAKRFRREWIREASLNHSGSFYCFFTPDLGAQGGFVGCPPAKTKLVFYESIIIAFRGRT